MIINRNGKNLLRLILADHILIQKLLDLFRFQQINIRKGIPLPLVAKFKLFFQNLSADVNTLITDISPVRPCNQLAHLILRLIAERTPHLIVVPSYHSLTSSKDMLPRRPDHADIAARSLTGS